MSEAPPRAEGDDTPEPMGPLKTVGEALQRLTLSPTARTMLQLAGGSAMTEPANVVGVRHLIRGAVLAGQEERTWQGAALLASVFVAAVQAAVAPELFAQRIEPRGGTATMDLPLSPLAADIIGHARALSKIANDEDYIAARHLVVALTGPLDPRLRGPLARVWRAQWGIDPTVLHKALREAVAAEAREGENPQAWMGLGGGVRIAPGFAADAPTPARLDPLGYAEEAARLAELACLKANTPPMAVALFGDWGSGKSTFMRRMQDSVEAIGTRWQDAPESPFTTRVAQIRFNAWSYADGDLWASMAAEIFRQLRTEIERLSGGAVAGAQYRALLDRVALRLGTAEAAQGAALGEIARLSREMDAKRAELTEVTDRAAAIQGASAAARLVDRVTDTLKQNPAAAAAALRALGFTDSAGEKQLAALVGEARAAVQAFGKASLLGRAVLEALRYPSGLLALGVVGAVGYGAFTHWQAAPALLASAVAVLAPLSVLWQRMRPIVDAAREFSAQEAAERTQLAARRTTLEAEIAALDARRAAQEAAQSREASLLASYAGAARGESPAALLKFFLEQDAGLQAYEQRLGLVSRLRESLETLEQILAEQSERDRLAAAVQPYLLAPPRAANLPSIDRIILYVDDLDRCQPGQVVPVLQALALMLQLKLFVAVVAVDERWLMAALSIHYKDVIDAKGMAGPAQFLEKIFQIPFWLRPMQSADESYRKFIAHLVPEVVTGPQQTIRVSETWEEGTTPDERGPWTREEALDPDELPQPEDEEMGAQESRDATVQRVALTQPELEVLTALAPLAGGTPRALKRFVNLYRLMRSSRQGEALEQWLGDEETKGEFRYAAFALACHTGVSAKVLSGISHEVGQVRTTGIVMLSDYLVRDLVKKHEPVQPDNLSQYLSDLAVMVSADYTQMMPAWALELENLEKLRVAIGLRALGELGRDLQPPPTSVGWSLKDFRPIWHEAARYSFNRPP